MFQNLLLLKLQRSIKQTWWFSIFLFRLSRLIWRERKNEFSFVAFNAITADYKVLTYFSCRETVDVFYVVLRTMSKQLSEALNKPSSPEHWNYKEGNT